MNSKKTTVSNHSSRQGFTLMEVLVSSALTVVILTMLFTVLIGAMNAWQTGTNRLQGNADARMALDSIAQDLQSMVVRQTSFDQEWLVSESGPIANRPVGTTLPSTQLFFFAPSLDRPPGPPGDVVAIQYQVAFADPFQEGPGGYVVDSDYNIFGLYKHMATTEDTFNNALGEVDIWKGFWSSRANPRSRDLLIPNVIKFDVSWSILARDNSTTPPSTQILVENKLLRLSNSFLSDTHDESLLIRLSYADISLTILTQEGMRMVQTFARGPGLNTDNLNRVIREHGRVYTKRVKIQY